MSTKHITSIVQSGVDAFTNMYEVLIYGPTFDADGAPIDTGTTPLISESRVGDFSPPEEAVEEYPTSYMMVKLTRLKPKLKVPKTLNIPIRVDKEFSQLTALRKWKEYYANLQNEGSWREAGPLNDTETILGRIVVNAFSSNTTDTKAFASWIFEDVICTQVGQPSFSREGSNYVRINPTFTFTRMREVTPGGTGEGKSNFTKDSAGALTTTTTTPTT